VPVAPPSAKKRLGPKAALKAAVAAVAKKATAAGTSKQPAAAAAAAAVGGAVVRKAAGGKAAAGDKACEVCAATHVTCCPVAWSDHSCFVACACMGVCCVHRQQSVSLVAEVHAMAVSLMWSVMWAACPAGQQEAHSTNRSCRGRRKRSGRAWQEQASEAGCTSIHSGVPCAPQWAPDCCRCC
jgi:hypothetical protein